MHLLLAAATIFEIQPTIDALGQKPVSGDGLSHIVTGVGGIATTWSLMRQIDIKRPDLIIQAGIAGCFTGHLPGEVFVIGEDQLADMGVWEEGGFHSLFDMGLADADDLPFTDGRLINPYHRVLALTGLPTVRGLTVNEITTDAARTRWYQQNTNAVVESMEGGSLHYVCLREGIPFLQLRSVSNTVGVRDKTKWDIGLAVARLNEQLIRIVKNLGSADRSIFEPSKH
jgi:futalosine hydrolase